MTRLSFLTFLFSFSLLVVAAEIELGGKLPAIKGETISEMEITVPENTKGEVTLVIVTFSKAAGKRAREWSQKYSTEYSPQKNAGVMQLIFLESVPQLFRGMVRSGIKKGMPKELHDRSVYICENEKEWKEMLHIEDKDDLPFLILLDHESNIEWLHHKPFAQEDYDQLKLKTDELIEKAAATE